MRKRLLLIWQCRTNQAFLSLIEFPHKLFQIQLAPTHTLFWKWYEGDPLFSFHIKNSPLGRQKSSLCHIFSRFTSILSQLCINCYDVGTRHSLSPHQLSIIFFNATPSDALCQCHVLMQRKLTHWDCIVEYSANTTFVLWQRCGSDKFATNNYTTKLINIIIFIISIINKIDFKI